MLETHPMLHINDLVYRISGRTILDGATAAIPARRKVGLVGRNGSGKTTLLKLITGELHAESGDISMRRHARAGMVAQEAPSGQATLIDWVLAQDGERAALMAEAETATDGHRIAELHTRLGDIDAWSAPARAAGILAGLGFDEAAQSRSLEEFSGGWRMRVALAALLFVEPDILLLDEPTNYLDLEGTLWLTSYLRTYPHGAIIISHDRDLLNSAVDGILHLEHGRLDYTPGGYDRFEKLRRERQALQLKLKKKQDDTRRHMEAFVERFRAQANKARQAQSRLKALQRLEPVAAMVEAQVAPFVFSAPERMLSPPLMQLDDVSVGYDPARPVLKHIDLSLDPRGRIGLLGANGNGKSTFAKLLAGRLEPFSGRRKISKKARIGYFAQHQMDELSGDMSPYDHFRALMAEATEAQIRTRLGALGFGVEKAQTAAANLSGGEKARLLFALAGFGLPHLLILDEPTNHLDVDSREALIRALNEYEGAVILISHDRHLLDACADELWLVEGGTVARFDGDMDDYRQRLLDARRGRIAGTGAKTGTNERQNRRQRAARARARIAPLKKKAQQAEKQLDRLLEDLGKLDEALAAPGLFATDPDKATELGRRRARTVRDIEQTENLWMEALETYEAARDNNDQTP